ncbi:MAG: ABC transporter ATP-binding protein [Dehalococcoidales bacterium]|nr:MAG: ABC transporter ATP-binding protein [Dehalococcoidales bacterium]
MNRSEWSITMKTNGTGDKRTVLEIDRVCKSYVKGTRVNDNISISLAEGEIFGLLGPNGAGKTTLVNQIIGLVKPDSGGIVLDGVDIVANPNYARQACSFQAQTQVPINGLTTMQAIELVGRVRGGGAGGVRKRTRELIRELEMEEWSRKTAESFSGGMRRLVAFCMAAVIPGRIVILDEPTNDVDPLRRRLLWQQVRNLIEKGSTVLLVTHNVLEAERTVDRLAIIDQGRVIGTGTPGSLKENGSRNMRLELILEPRSEVPESPGFMQHTILNGRRMIVKLEDDDVAPAMQWARKLKDTGVVEEFSVGPSTLEDVYVKMVGNSDALIRPEQEIENGTYAS